MKTWKERICEEDNELRPRTLMELYGRGQLLVEHHRGILSYASTCIRIGTTFGVLTVEGEELRLCSMSRSQLVIRGTLSSVRLEEGS